MGQSRDVLPYSISAEDVSASQKAPAGQPYARALTAVLIANDAATRVDNVDIVFRVDGSGPGRPALRKAGTTGAWKSAVSATTDAQGMARVEAVAGSLAGRHTVLAQQGQAANSPAHFELTVEKAQPDTAVDHLELLGGDRQSTFLGEPFGVALQVRALDASQAPRGVADATVAFQLFAQGQATFSGGEKFTTGQTDANGLVTPPVDLVAGAAPGRFYASAACNDRTAVFPLALLPERAQCEFRCVMYDVAQQGVNVAKGEVVAVQVRFAQFKTGEGLSYAKVNLTLDNPDAFSFPGETGTSISRVTLEDGLIPDLRVGGAATLPGRTDGKLSVALADGAPDCRIDIRLTWTEARH
jgi:hypothetical protein